MIDLVFWLFCLLTIGGGVYVLLSKNVLYAAYGLLSTFLGVAGMFVFAGAEFMAAAQIMIYVGGIMILLIFGIMLSTRRKYLVVEDAAQNRGILVAVLLAAVWIVLIIKLRLLSGEPVELISIKKVGLALMTSHVLILELVGVILLMALVGATYIARDDR
ncbi:NADH-ubiquinone/plastoquinone oxidoreductase chain 6 [Leadbetterella byssophila DSM 17132]|jgi:NADH-quinone oxidoreductase subunit J|uniref:NADH-quinone oxidoreductase subunit J n=1 Tax=Leadbetterella byssophila (strain DSM 17132 / JCM 16389 / KACC 11308 / NBRC 106382 / 4M15) TaxID=649349 RepID=E4RZC6_LEAB4|nr:NADH-quinone oxidoreductase subunit J [Leadbetterella byssophila]ADQ16465.1 NADH-ubiquinone/plastoquinone oxidoreductase chain 6 [Leadbetterella byssophila DSM 17132]